MKTSSSGRRATSSGALLGAVLAACGGVADGPAASVAGVSAAAPGAPMGFGFDSLDDRPVSAEVTRGKPTVLVFVTTGSLPSQAEVAFLVAMSARDAASVNYALVSLDPPENRELVEIYAKAMHVPFPTALADESTRQGAGPFGDVSAVPVSIVLDRAGRTVWRADGRVAKSDELRAAMKGL